MNGLTLLFETGRMAQLMKNNSTHRFYFAWYFYGAEDLVAVGGA